MRGLCVSSLNINILKRLRTGQRQFLRNDRGVIENIVSPKTLPVGGFFDRTKGC